MLRWAQIFWSGNFDLDDNPLTGRPTVIEDNALNSIIGSQLILNYLDYRKASG